MTGERFQYNVNKNCIECDEKFVAYMDMVDGFRIANKLTTLAEENKHLLKENEQLKSFIQKLQNSDGNIVLINGQGYTKSYVEKLLNKKEI